MIANLMSNSSLLILVTRKAKSPFMSYATTFIMLKKLEPLLSIFTLKFFF